MATKGGGSGGDNASATFRLALEDAVSGPAASSAAGLESLRQKLEADTQALRGMQNALRNLKSGGVAADKTVSSLKDKIAVQKATIAGSQAGLIKLGAGFARVKNAAGGAEKGTSAVSAALSYAGGPLAKYASGLKSLGAFAFSLPGILIAVAAAIVAVAAVTANALASLVRYGIATADARRNELLRLEGLAKIRNFWSGFATTQTNAAATAGFLQQQIDAVSSSVAIGRDQVAGYAEQLYRMGLRGGNLQAALQGVATTAAVQGDAAANAFASWAAGANLTGQSVKALAADVKARLGGIAAAQLLSLDVQTRKMHESFAMLFSGLRLDGLLNGVRQVTDLFSQSSASGRALKVIVEALFQPLIDSAGRGAPIVKRFFQGLVIGALYTTIAILKVRNWLRATFGPDVIGRIDLAKAALYAGAAVAGSLAASLALVAASAAFIAAPIVTAGVALWKLVSTGARVVAWFRATDWGSVGRDIALGIARGLLGSVKDVIEAAKNLAKNTSAAFKSALGIQSPSRLFRGHGLMVGAGAAAGIEAGRPMARHATHRLARDVAYAGAGIEAGTSADAGGYSGGSAAVSGAGVEAAAGGGAGGGGNHFHFGDIHMHGGGADAKEQARSFRAELEEIFMGVNVHLGGRRPSTA